MNHTKSLSALGRKVLASVVLTLTALSVMAPRSHATPTEDAVLNAFNESAAGARVIGGANNSDAVNLLFTGKTQAGAAATSTGAYVTISATAMTFYQPFATLDTSMGTSGVVTYASTLGSNTMGALCDYINSRGLRYKCTLIGAQRNDPPVILRTQTATDGTNNLAATVLNPLKGGLNVDVTTTTFVSLGIVPAPGKRVILNQCITYGESGVNDQGFAVYGQLRKYGAVASPFATDTWGTAVDDSYVVWRSTPVVATITTIPSTNLFNWLEFAQDAHVVVRQGNIASTTVQTASDSVQCAWKER